MRFCCKAGLGEEVDSERDRVPIFEHLQDFIMRQIKIEREYCVRVSTRSCYKAGQDGKRERRNKHNKPDTRLYFH